MQATASVRALRNHFKEVRTLLEKEGEVLLTERGKKKYRLTPYIETAKESPARIDFWARLTASQPEPLSAEASRALHEDNRGDR